MYVAHFLYIDQNLENESFFNHPFRSDTVYAFGSVAKK